MLLCKSVLTLYWVKKNALQSLDDRKSLSLNNRFKVRDLFFFFFSEVPDRLDKCGIGEETLTYLLFSL